MSLSEHLRFWEKMKRQFARDFHEKRGNPWWDRMEQRMDEKIEKLQKRLEQSDLIR